MSKHYPGETGTEIRVDCGVDVSSATATYIYCKKPTGTVVTWTATVYNSNYLRYYTLATDFDVAGTYRIQAGVTIGTWTGRGETATFEVTPLYL